VAIATECRNGSKNTSFEIRNASRIRAVRICFPGRRKSVRGAFGQIIPDLHAPENKRAIHCQRSTFETRSIAAAPGNKKKGPARTPEKLGVETYFPFRRLCRRYPVQHYESAVDGKRFQFQCWGWG
jgi:hypothetical protein